MTDTNFSKNFNNLAQQTHDLLEYVSSRRVTVSAAAKALNIHQPAAHNAIRKAIERCSGELLISEYPGAAKEILEAYAKMRAKQTAGARPSIPAEHPPDIPVENAVNAIDDKMLLALAYIDRYQIANAKLSEINSTLKTLFDMSQVLRGQPTSISSNGDAAKTLKELVPALMQEIKRRGMIDVKGEVVVVEQQKPARRGVEREASRAPATDGPPSAHPPGGFCGGPVKPRAKSEFLNLIEEM